MLLINLLSLWEGICDECPTALVSIAHSRAILAPLLRNSLPTTELISANGVLHTSLRFDGPVAKASRVRITISETFSYANSRTWRTKDEPEGVLGLAS